MAKCFKCDSELIWQNDFTSEEVGYTDLDEDEYFVSYYECPNCGCFYEMQDKGKDFESTEKEKLC